MCRLRQKDASILMLVSFALLCVRAPGQPPSPRSPHHFQGVDSRGDKAMGFSHEMTSHHFLLLKSGGAIEIEAENPSDSPSKEAIRDHLAKIARMFSQGDFQLPMFIHDRVPPGVDTMKRLQGKITYIAESTPKDAQVRITTQNSEALKAIHDFLRFQIIDHRTKDSLHVHQ
jgi:hypothetical protein